jgi:epoxyqueuosine reductase
MGVVAAMSLPWRQHFDAWLVKGMHGQMRYLERQADKRRDLSLVMAGFRSVLVLAMNYHAAADPSYDPSLGRISRYAWGGDYHGLMNERLRALVTYIKNEEPEAEGLCYADTGPVMEKTWGAHSALGWMGKHSNLICREQGSWFFIGVILLNCGLDYDVAEKDYCGSCTRCLGACPTGAIVAPYIVDARLCISYLTIELKGVMPRHLRSLTGNHIFGCDDCQEVCPWNRFAISTNEKAFLPRESCQAPVLAGCAAITAAEFNVRFRNSPIRRVKRDGFVRNVVVALGNSHRSDAVPALARAMRDASVLVRGHAAWALGQIDVPEARIELQKARDVETDPWVLEEIRMAYAPRTDP